MKRNVKLPKHIEKHMVEAGKRAGKKIGFVEPETFPVFYRETVEHNEFYRTQKFYPIEFRIIRERDYQKLLNAAMGRTKC